MLPVRVLSPQFDLLEEIDDYQSLIFTRRYFRAGEFELHLSLDKDTGVLQADNIIMLGSDGHKCGIVLYRGIELDEAGNEKLVVKGYTLQGVLKRRVTVPGDSGYDRISGPAETVMKHYVDVHCVSPADTNRIIPLLVNAPDGQRGTSTPWQTRFEKLDDVLQAIGEFCGIGWEVYFDTRAMNMVFDVLPGRVLTADQDALPPVIFSVEFDNIKGQNYVENSLGYVNVGYAGGKGEDVDRLILTVGEAQGLDRREDFFDCSSAEDAAELTAEGNKKLADTTKITTLEASVISSSFIYGSDWNLGDIVTVQNRKWGVTMNTRITEVRETYESGKNEIDVVFGDEIPTILTKIKKATEKIVR